MKVSFPGPCHYPQLCGWLPLPQWQQAAMTLVPAGRLLAAGHPAFSPAQRTSVCHWDYFASSPAWFGSCEDKRKASTWWACSLLWPKAAQTSCACLILQRCCPTPSRPLTTSKRIIFPPKNNLKKPLPTRYWKDLIKRIIYLTSHTFLLCPN